MDDDGAIQKNIDNGEQATQRHDDDTVALALRCARLRKLHIKASGQQVLLFDDDVVKEHRHSPLVQAGGVQLRLRQRQIVATLCGRVDEAIGGDAAEHHHRAILQQRHKKKWAIESERDDR